MNNFESREGEISYSEEVIYRFITDIRNFERFIPADSVKNWMATDDTCSFEISYGGMTRISITQKKPYYEVNYAGRGFQNTEFFFKINIIKRLEKKTAVKVVFQAALNPMLKMIVAKPLETFLEKMITEMEKFDGWEKTSD
jgi:carbon monoxide dehydrogenase subunit G